MREHGPWRETQTRGAVRVDLCPIVLTGIIKRMKYRQCCCCLLFAFALLTPGVASAHKVDFGANGTPRIDGKPFFPIGVWVYGLNTDVMADLHEHHFNTILGHSFPPSDLP